MRPMLRFNAPLRPPLAARLLAPAALIVATLCAAPLATAATPAAPKSPAAAASAPGAAASADTRLRSTDELLAERMKKKKAQQAAAQAQARKLVDINSAGVAELKTLPGVDEALAAKIIAARPYLTKAELVTKNVMPTGPYLSLRHQVVAMQKQPLQAAKPKAGSKP